MKLRPTNRLMLALVWAFVSAFTAGAQEPPPTVHEIRILVRSGHLYVQATVGMHSALLLIDTGASSSTFVLALAPKHDSAPGNVQLKTALAGAPNIPTLDVPILIEGANDSEGVRKIVSGVFGPFDFGPAKGVLGMDVLGQYATIKFDLKRQMMILEELPKGSK
jgi:hypothetical protein